MKIDLEIEEVQKSKILLSAEDKIREEIRRRLREMMEEKEKKKEEGKSFKLSGTDADNRLDKQVKGSVISEEDT